MSIKKPLLVCGAFLLLLVMAQMIPTPGPIIATTEPMFLYVAANGSDYNTCASTTNPCLTIQAAVNKVPKLIRHPVQISVGPGGGFTGAYLSGFSVDQVGAANQDAGPYFSIQGTMVQAALGGVMSGTVTSATTGTTPGSGPGSNSGPANWSTVTVTGAGWTSNALAHYPICFTSGLNAPSCSTISTNTSTVATIGGVFNINTPSGGDAFIIETWATEIDGGMPRPPGAMSLQGFSGVDNFPTAFFVAGNNAPGWKSGYGAGFGNDTQYWNNAYNFGTITPFGDASFVEPQINISQFRFDNGDNMVSLGATGANELVGFQLNNVQTGIAVVATGASFYAISNYIYQDPFGDYDFRINNYMDSFQALTVPVTGSNFGFMYNNYAVASGAGFPFLLCGAHCVVADNYITSTVSGTDDGVQMFGQATLTSSGNEYLNLGYGVEGQGSYNSVIYTDSDDFSADRFGIRGSTGTDIEMGEPQAAGNGPTSLIQIPNQTANCFILTYDTKIHLHQTVMPTFCGDSGAFFIDTDPGVGGANGYPTQAQLIRDGGIFISTSAAVLPNAGLVGWSPGTVLDLSSGAAIYEN